MLNRLTVSALLKTVILATAFCVVVGFSLNAWDSWGRDTDGTVQGLAQSAGRIGDAAAAAEDVKQASQTLETQSQQLGGH